MINAYNKFTAEEKEQIIKEVFGDRVPIYQWFGLTIGASINKAEIAKATGTPLDPTNLETHGSRFPTGVALRLRNASRIVTEIPQKPELAGQPIYAPLYQAVNNYMAPYDGWVDFLESTIISGNPEHEAIAQRHGLNFELCTPETERAKLEAKLAELNA